MLSVNKWTAKFQKGCKEAAFLRRFILTLIFESLRAASELRRDIIERFNKKTRRLDSL